MSVTPQHWGVLFGICCAGNAERLFNKHAGQILTFIELRKYVYL